MFLTSAEDAETGQRGYVLTGDETYLRPYSQALSEIEASLQRIQELTKQDDAQQSQLAELRKHVQVMMQELSATLQLDREQEMEAARKRPASAMQRWRRFDCWRPRWRATRNAGMRKRSSDLKRVLRKRSSFCGSDCHAVRATERGVFFVYRNSAYRERSPETDGENASVVMNKVQEHLAETVQKREWEVTFSVGVLTFPKAINSAEEMVKAADRAGVQGEAQWQERHGFGDILM